MKSAFAYLACCLIFSAIDALSSWHVSFSRSLESKNRTHWIYRLDDRRIKQLSWATRLPLLITLLKVQAVQMPNHTGHGNAALTPWLGKREIEVIVLDVGIAVYVTLSNASTTEAHLKI